MDLKLITRPQSSCHTPTNAQDLSNDQFIIQFPAYRRLCNIVKEHELSNCKSIFRNNLIKQLYFLLKLAPIIQSALMQNFLGQVEQWYNLNDHKKIKLPSKNLQSMMKTISAPKDRYKDDSSINNQNYQSENYIRPNTAKYSTFKSNIRPISSYKGQMSTNVCTNQQYRQEQPSFTVNIQQELERSQDFINRHRTVHPEQQPYHQQLFKLVNHKTQNKPQFKRNFSANVLTRKSNNFKPTTQIIDKQQFKDNQDQNQDIQDIGEINDEDISQNQSASEINTHISKTKKVYLNDPKKINKRPLTALATSNKLTLKQKQFLSRIQKISTLQQSKQLRRGKQDNLFISQKRQYIRRKVKLNQDISRKIQAKRMKSQSKIIYKKNNKQQPFPIEQKQEKIQVKDFTGGLITEENKQLPRYDQYAFFKTKRQNQIKQWRKPIRYSQPKKKPNFKTFINTCRINSALKFDLLSHENIEMHNKQNLQEMIKIKQKLYGRIWVDSNALMKGLYIDAYDNLNQQNSTQCLWKNKDHNYLMISNGTKKKKKPKRKILKKKNK